MADLSVSSLLCSRERIKCLYRRRRNCEFEFFVVVEAWLPESASADVKSQCGYGDHLVSPIDMSPGQKMPLQHGSFNPCIPPSPISIFRSWGSPETYISFLFAPLITVRKLEVIQIRDLFIVFGTFRSAASSLIFLHH